ncbi:MAG: quinone-dependent dihydroorotate dehydrogenase [Hyphomonadaceae bacterium]|nr:quinone-dependent dihydroorotate dehydrogenase [Hyphomonadaceae bacterium]MBC6411497.1 quinone-dependent dihydroorotate dehydrogenase [Hyphomonadaceae bacterium]
MGFYNLAASLVKLLPPEAAHRATIRALRLGLGPVSLHRDDPVLETEVGGLFLPNPVGLAAGFDKDAEVPDAMLAMGFGFVECGSVTPHPQAGNPGPRLFRLAEDKAIINRMGFNSAGMEHFRSCLEGRRPNPGLVGANLGANRDSADRVADYVTGLKTLWGLADYFTVNISSPNTPGLRGLQSGDAMDDLLGRVQEARQELTGDAPSVPVFLKVAPDIELPDVERITQQARTYGINAIIVSNTTIARPDTLESPHASEAGGLSGAPLMKKSTLMLKEFAAAARGRIDLIGVGGITGGADAYAKIRAGARAVQLYSALVYHGPALVRTIKRDLAARLKADGFNSVAEAVKTA